MTRVFVGMLGLVVLGLAIVVGLFAAFGDLGAETPTESTVVGLEATPEQAGQDEPTAEAAAIGETVTTGDVAWTVTETYPATELRTYTIPQETVSGNYVVLTYTVENVSEEPVTLTQETITLFDEAGIEYKPEPDRNNPFVMPEKNLLFTEAGLLEPGQAKEGKVNFEVVPTSSDFVVQLGDTDPTVEEERYVDLGF